MTWAVRVRTVELPGFDQPMLVVSFPGGDISAALETYAPEPDPLAAARAPFADLLARAAGTVDLRMRAARRSGQMGVESSAGDRRHRPADP